MLICDREVMRSYAYPDVNQRLQLVSIYDRKVCEGLLFVVSRCCEQKSWSITRRVSIECCALRSEVSRREAVLADPVVRQLDFYLRLENGIGKDRLRDCNRLVAVKVNRGDIALLSTDQSQRLVV